MYKWENFWNFVNVGHAETILIFLHEAAIQLYILYIIWSPLPEKKKKSIENGLYTQTNLYFILRT